MIVRELLRTGRREAGLSQRDLAHRAGVPQSTIGRIESGAVQPRAATTERIVGALGLVLTLEPRWGDGVDRTLVRRFLRMSPRQRIEYGASAGEAMRRLREAVAGRP